MKNRPLLSVIIANYNNAPYLEDCLDGIINQTYKDLEIIVYDDCSNDRSPEIIRDYEKNYPGIVKGIFSPVNRGVARARHEAILQARGEYITTLDSDDYYYEPRKLEKEIEMVTRYKKKQGMDILAFSDILLVRENKTVIGAMGEPDAIHEGFILKEILSRSCLIPRDFIMKRAAYFEAGGYDCSLKTHEDWDLKIRLAARYEFYFTKIFGTAYRRHGKGLSSIPIKCLIDDLWKVFKKNIRLIDDKKERETIEKKFSTFIDRTVTARENYPEPGYLMNVPGKSDA